jgi:hypothetical protein
LIREGEKLRWCFGYHKSGDQIASLHTNHAKAKIVIPVQKIVKQMRWYKEGKHETEDLDIMSHPADSEARQSLYRFDPKFAGDPRSVRLDFSADGFQPYSTDSHLYSCWLVFVMPNNLPPDKCLKEGFIFLAHVILMHTDYSMVRKSLSLIVIEDSFPCVTL